MQQAKAMVQDLKTANTTSKKMLKRCSIRPQIVDTQFHTILNPNIIVSICSVLFIYIYIYLFHQLTSHMLMYIPIFTFFIAERSWMRRKVINASFGGLLPTFFFISSAFTGADCMLFVRI